MRRQLRPNSPASTVIRKYGDVCKNHKDTKTQRKAAIKRFFDAAFLCVLVSLWFLPYVTVITKCSTKLAGILFITRGALMRVVICAFLAVIFWTFTSASFVSGQSVASGTIEGTVVDSTGGVVVGAMVEMLNPVTGFRQTAVTDSMGAFRFTNVPFNPYHTQVTQQGFAPSAQDVNVRTTVPIPVK